MKVMVETSARHLHVTQEDLETLFGKGAVKLYAVIVVVFIVVGSTLKVDLVWSLSDMFNGLMVLPNLIGLLALSGLVVKITRGSGDQLHR